MATRKEEALAYHSEGRPGKIQVVPTKPIGSQRELSLAYSPGVAEPCREIAADRSKVGLYTARRNLVAVITNGTAVLGLGNIGPYAAKPVMEGKAVLFKKYADIDVFDIEVDATDPDRFIEVVAALEPTFGGINIEDVKAPECFRIEQTLIERMNIPVMHDDQHGTAIISAAALMNACEIQGKALADVKVTCIGAGAAALGCMRLWTKLGVRIENMTLYDVDGVVREDREGLDATRRPFARPLSDPRRTLLEALEDADVMLGLSAGNLVTPSMLRGLAPKPIIFALANPDPEIGYGAARLARPDAIVGTGRSDFPNQVNNVLGFPYIFRGALDVQATRINDAMKLAAARALAQLAREGVPDDVLAAYGGQAMKFGADYIIPKPVDLRSLRWVAAAVAEAAMESGVAREPIDVERYRDELDRKLSPTRRVMNAITATAKKEPKRVVFPEGETDAILRAAEVVAQEGIAKPVLLGRIDVIRERAEEIGVSLDAIELIDRGSPPKLDTYAERLWRIRQRKGLTLEGARAQLERSRTYYGMMMVHAGDADGLLGGLTQAYATTIRPALEIIGIRKDVHRAAGAYVLITPHGPLFLADTTINIDPDAETLAHTAKLTSDLAKGLGVQPRIAMLSFSNFGDAPHPNSRKVAEAARIAKARWPDLEIDGEMQADVALSAATRTQRYPFTTLRGEANVLIFPNLESGNIAYKILGSIGGAEVIGPIVLGMRRAVNALQQGASVNTIVHMTAITAARAAAIERNGPESLT